MKTKTNNQQYIKSDLIALILIGVFISMPTLVQAQDEDMNRRVIHQRILNKFDHDGDGTLNDREKYQARKFYARLKNKNNGSDVRPDRVRPDVDRPDRVRPDVNRPDRVRPHTDRARDIRPDRARVIRHRIDRNNDGRIGQRERHAARRIHARRVR